MLLWPLPAWAQLAEPDEEAIETYRAALRAVETQTTERGMETAFAQLWPVRQTLIRPRDSRWTLIESLTDGEFQKLLNDLPGLKIIRNELLFAGPDPDYFVKLADARGEPVDRAFFAALKATYPDGVRAAYVQQQTDASGCTRFGSGTLVGTHQLWSEFQRAFPDRYVVAARREVERVSSELTQSTCACGDAASVVQEMEAFVAALQASPIRARLIERVDALRAGRSDIRTSCIAK